MKQKMITRSIIYIR